MTGKRTETETTLQVLALIARGDTYEATAKQTGIAPSTVADIKRRNPQALETMQKKLIDHKLSQSKKILDKTHNIINKKLERIEVSEDKREFLFKQFQDGIINADEYQTSLIGLLDASLTELNAIQREAFHESQIEQGKPTSISDNPKQATEDFLALAEAIKSSDEVVLERLIFNQGEPD